LQHPDALGLLTSHFDAGAVSLVEPQAPPRARARSGAGAAGGGRTSRRGRRLARGFDVLTAAGQKQLSAAEAGQHQSPPPPSPIQPVLPKPPLPRSVAESSRASGTGNWTVGRGLRMAT